MAHYRGPPTNGIVDRGLNPNYFATEAFLGPVPNNRVDYGAALRPIPPAAFVSGPGCLQPAVFPAHCQLLPEYVMYNGQLSIRPGLVPAARPFFHPSLAAANGWSFANAGPNVNLPPTNVPAQSSSAGAGSMTSPKPPAKQRKKPARKTRQLEQTNGNSTAATSAVAAGAPSQAQLQQSTNQLDRFRQEQLSRTGLTTSVPQPANLPYAAPADQPNGLRLPPESRCLVPPPEVGAVQQKMFHPVATAARPEAACHVPVFPASSMDCSHVTAPPPPPPQAARPDVPVPNLPFPLPTVPPGYRLVITHRSLGEAAVTNPQQQVTQLIIDNPTDASAAAAAAAAGHPQHPAAAAAVESPSILSVSLFELRLD